MGMSPQLVSTKTPPWLELDMKVKRFQIIHVLETVLHKPMSGFSLLGGSGRVKKTLVSEPGSHSDVSHFLFKVSNILLPLFLVTALLTDSHMPNNSPKF